MLPDIICISFNKAPSSEDFPDAVLPTIIVNTPCQQTEVEEISRIKKNNIVNICRLSRLTAILDQKLNFLICILYLLELTIDQSSTYWNHSFDCPMSISHLLSTQCNHQKS